MPVYSHDEVKLVDKESGEEIVPGSTVMTFRGDEMTFAYVSQLPTSWSEGKVILTQVILTNDTNDAFSGREFYPSVINARIMSP